MKLFTIVLYLLALTSLFVFAQDDNATENEMQHEVMQDEEMSEDVSEDSEVDESEADIELTEATSEAGESSEEDSETEVETEGVDSEVTETEVETDESNPEEVDLEQVTETIDETGEGSEEDSETEVETEEVPPEETTEETTDEIEEGSEEDSETEITPENDAELTDDEAHDMGSMEMQHDSVEASQEMNVQLNVYKDIFSGYSIQLIVNGLTFTPENAGKEHVDGEGHAHLYIDGEKIARVYGTTFHLGNILSEGEHEIKISLNGNDHSPYTYNGEAVEDTFNVEVGGHGTVGTDEEMTVELSVNEDALSGYNIHVEPTGFAFSAANPGVLYVNGKGYAQIFVNGKMLARSYTPWYHLCGCLFHEGENEIRVKLLSNNHNYYAYRGKAVSSTVLVNVASAESAEETEPQTDIDMEGHVGETEASAEEESSMEGHDMDTMDEVESEEDSEVEEEFELTESIDDIEDDSEEAIEPESEVDSESINDVEDASEVGSEVEEVEDEEITEDEVEFEEDVEDEEVESVESIDDVQEDSEIGSEKDSETETEAE